MPIYEYACGKCEHEFEVEQRISDDPVKTCPECRSRKVKRLISRTSFVLKGGGWYSDLYSSSPADKGGEGEKSEGESKGASAEKKDGKDAKESKKSEPKQGAAGAGSKSKGKGKAKAAAA